LSTYIKLSTAILADILICTTKNENGVNRVIHKKDPSALKSYAKISLMDKL